MKRKNRGRNKILLVRDYCSQNKSDIAVIPMKSYKENQAQQFEK